ncbi:MAG TPA: FAD-linked oxidase C-terminal domain-containing protein [Gemmatimonadales bacterium]|nr:FAD-linked oxidase C-terminal domain-containing protein [Gemmatimonadales bacterium]
MATAPSLLARDLAAIVGATHVRDARAERVTYAMDGLPTHRRVPDLVVLPGTREELVAVVRLLAALDVPFVPRGAGTGLSGGALADEGTVLIVLTRLNRIVRIDRANRLAIVEPGVVNAKLSAATRPAGLHYAPDPSSQTACTIGGNVAENAGGPHCLKYGVTANHILALEVLLADGSLVELGSPGGEPWGPDLVGVFVGSEGNFGVTTRITVRLTPVPRAVRTLLADFTSIRTAGEGVSAIIAAGIVPAALEMMDQSCIRAVEDSVYAAGYPRDAAAILLVELDGRNADAVIAETEAVTELLRKSGARSVRSASTEAERERLWQGRKKAFGAMGRLSRDLVVQDAVVPRSALPDVLETIFAIAGRYGLVVSNVFHAGDGNLHPNISFDATDPDLKQRVEAASAEIMSTCIAAGGTITGEHGIGIDKLRYMPLIFDAESLGAMQAVRRVFDPEERVNPGKVVPVHACREWSSLRIADFGLRNRNAGVQSAIHNPQSAMAEPVP